MMPYLERGTEEWEARQKKAHRHQAVQDAVSGIFLSVPVYTAVAATLSGAIAVGGQFAALTAMKHFEEHKELRGDFGPQVAAATRLEKDTREAIANGTPLRVYLDSSNTVSANATCAPVSALDRLKLVAGTHCTFEADPAQVDPQHLTLQDGTWILAQQRPIHNIPSARATYKFQIDRNDLSAAMKSQLRANAEPPESAVQTR